MGSVAILNPQDVLRDRFNYNRMPLISKSTSTNQSLKSRVRNPDFTPNSNPNPNPNSNPKSVSNSNRRKRSPQKKTNDLPRIRLTKVSSSGKGLLRSMADGANFNRSKISNGPSLVMGKVKILKRGQALENDEEAGKKVALFDKEIKNEMKTVLFGEEIKSEKKAVVFDKENKSEKKTVLFDKEITSEKRVLVEKKIKQEKMGVLRKDEDVKRIQNSKSVQTLLIRLGPDSNVLPKFYAGSAFVDSPPPSSVPLPNFLAAETNDYESSNLRRLLKLDG